MVAGDHHVRGRSRSAVEVVGKCPAGPDHRCSSVVRRSAMSDTTHQPGAFLRPRKSRSGAQLHKVTSARVMHWRRWFHIPPDPHVSSEAVSG